MSPVRFCERCNVQLRPDFPGDGLHLCAACKALAREEAGADSPGDPGNRVTLWFILIVLGGSVAAGAAWWVAAKILAGAG